MNKRQKKKQIREKNKKLIEKFPFLKTNNDYFDYTLLDEMPIGWRKKFGNLICEYIREELIKTNSLYDYKVLEIKEKYGQLCWYDNNYENENIKDIISKFEYISKHTCVFCGSLDATIIQSGWIVPLCKECCKKNCCFDNEEIEELFSKKEILHNFFPIIKNINNKEKEYLLHIKDILIKMEK